MLPIAVLVVVLFVLAARNSYAILHPSKCYGNQEVGIFQIIYPVPSHSVRVVFVYSFYRSVQRASWKYDDSDPQQMTTWVRLNTGNIFNPFFDSIILLFGSYQHLVPQSY